MLNFRLIHHLKVPLPSRSKLFELLFYARFMELHAAGLSSLGVPGVPWHTQILADQLTLFQPGGQIMPT